MPPKKLKKKDFERFKKEKHIERRDILAEWIDGLHDYIQQGYGTLLLKGSILREMYPDVESEELTVDVDKKFLEKYNVLMGEYYELNISDPIQPYTKEELIAELNPNNSELIAKTYKFKTIKELRKLALDAHNKRNEELLRG